MTEQPPSAEALELAESLWWILGSSGGDARERSKLDAAERIDRFADRVCEQRVSAETERYARWHDEQYRSLRDHPTGPEGLVTSIAGAHMAAHRESAEHHRAAERPSPISSALTSTGEQLASPAAVVDYTERARELAAMAPRMDAAVEAEFARRISAALSAVASEHQAAAIRARAALLARLREPEMREAVARAMAEYNYEGDIWDRLQEDEAARRALPRWQRDDEPTATKEEYRQEAAAALGLITEKLK